MATSGVYLTYQSGLGHQVLPPSLSPSLLQGIGWQTPPAILNFCSPGAGLPFPNCLSLYSPTISATQALFILSTLYPPGLLAPWLSPLCPCPVSSHCLAQGHVLAVLSVYSKLLLHHT